MLKNVRPWLRFIEGIDGQGGAGSSGGSGDSGGEGSSGDQGGQGSGDRGDGEGSGDGDSSDDEGDPEPEPEPEPEPASEPPAKSGQADDKEETEDISPEAFKELQAEVAALKADKAKQAEAQLAAEAEDVAKAHGIPEGMADRLQGKTREELEADAKQLAQVLGTRATDPTQGHGGSGNVRRSIGDVIAAKVAAAGLK